MVFGTAKYNAQEEYPRLRRKAGDQPLEEYNPEFVTELDKIFTKASEEVREEVGKMEDAPEFIKSFVPTITDTQTVLVIANLYAQYRQDIALQKTKAFLENDAVVPAFVRRLQSLCEEDNEQFREYPGLLELLATHIQQEQQANMLQMALQRTAPEPDTYAHQFIEDMGEGAATLPKELSAAVGVMEIAARIVDSEFSLSRQQFIGLFADRVATWPQELQTRLAAYAAGRTSAQWVKLKSALSPFVRAGRLPAEASQVQLTGPAKRKPQLPEGVPQSKRSTTAPIKKVTLARANQNHEDLIGNTERQPISHFAVLVAKGDKAGMRFTIESVADIGELFHFSNLEDYIESYRNDTTVRPVLEAVMAHLTVTPKDPAHTVQLKGVTYVRDDTGLERAPRRFSPQHFPGVAKGDISTRTRLLYDVFNYGGHPTLVVYGAFIKGDIEAMSKMPRIR